MGNRSRLICFEVELGYLAGLLEKIGQNAQVSID